MKVDLKDAAFCGQWCSERELQYKVKNWFEKSSMQFFYTGKLINEFGYKDYDEIELSGHFIPVFKTDVVALKKEFVAEFYSHEVEDEILMIMEHNKNKHSNFTGYDVAFNIFCEEHEDFWDAYWDYERSRLFKDAEKWCIENGIPYYTPDDPERKLDLSDALLYGYGGGWKKFDFWFCKKEFRFMDYADIEIIYGYKTHDEIVSSGIFVLFPRADPDKIDRTQLMEYAEQWAVKNNIPYYIPKDRPDHLGSQFREE